MAKSEINNEFILLRHAVRQARVCIVNKLIKEAKLLRDRHGNEAQKEKCRRKADKLIDEVYALKTIKDDDISKFGLLDERSLTKILQDQSSSNSVRVMAKVANYKTLNKRLTQFKERFPDCKKHLIDKKKKKTSIKLKDKEAVKIKKAKVKSQNKSSRKQKDILDKNVEQLQYNSEDEEAYKNERSFSETKSNSRKRKKTSEECTSLEKQKSLKLEKDSTSETTITDKQSNVIKSSSITKEATVKRFTELLEEQESNQDAQMSVESQDSTGTTTEQVKMVDDFFMTSDSQNYQSSSASTSYIKSHRYDTRAKPFQLNDRLKQQNANRKNDTNLNKKHTGKQSFSMKSNKINKSANKSNTNRNKTINKKDDNASLHPSWMAKKKEQEIMSQGFQGKKIVFTDD